MQESECLCACVECVAVCVCVRIFLAKEASMSPRSIDDKCALSSLLDFVAFIVLYSEAITLALLISAGSFKEQTRNSAGNVETKY